MHQELHNTSFQVFIGRWYSRNMRDKYSRKMRECLTIARLAWPIYVAPSSSGQKLEDRPQKLIRICMRVMHIYPRFPPSLTRTAHARDTVINGGTPKIHVVTRANLAGIARYPAFRLSPWGFHGFTECHVVMASLPPLLFIIPLKGNLEISPRTRHSR